MVGSRLAGQIPRLVAAVLAATGIGIVIDTAMPQVTSAALSGSGTAGSPYLIATCADLLEIDNSTANLAATYRLVANIDCAGVPFSTIYLTSPETYFSGTLDGNGKTISNLTVSCSGYFCGMFRKLAGATISDLTFANPNITGTNGSVSSSSNVGTLAGYALSGSVTTLQNVSVSGGTITGDGQYVGGLVGSFVEGVIVGASSTATVNGGSYVGGIVGILGSSSAAVDVLIRNSYSAASVSATQSTGLVGGIAGSVTSSAFVATNGVFDSTSAASVVATASSTVGGITGYLANATLEDVRSEGTVTGVAYVGGIVGWSRGFSDRISRAFSSATVTAGGQTSNTGRAGGIAGAMDYGSVSESASVGSVSGTYRVAGLIGIASSANISNTYSRATITRISCPAGVTCSEDSLASLVGRGTYSVSKSYGSGSMPNGVHGLGGDMGFSGTCSSSFWDTTGTGVATTRCNATGKSTAQMKDISTFTNVATSGLTSAWDFTGTQNDDASTADVWAIDPAINDGYPYLSNVPGLSAVGTPWGLSLTQATDSGASNVDGITNIGSVVVTGWANSGDTIQLYVNGVSSGSPCTASAGRFSCTPSTLAAGATYTVRAQATSGSSVGLMSATLSVVVDDTALAPSGLDLITASDSGSSTTDDLTNDTTPTVTGTAEASGIVQLYVDGVASGSTCAAAVSDGAFTCTAATVGPGSRNITAVVTDVAGNVSLASSALVIQIDTTAPSAPTGLDLNSADDSGSSATDNITTTTTLRIAGTADANVVVQLYRNGVATGSTCVADGVGVFECTTATLGAGAYSMTAKAVDTAGNLSTASPSLVVTVDLAAAAPASLDLKSTSDSGSSTSDNLTNDTTPTFSATVENGSVVQLYVDGVASGSTCTATSTSVDCTTATLSDGAKTITMVQTDVVGNVSVPSAGLTITIDSTAPSAPTLQLTTASDSGSSNSDGITNDTTPTFEGVAEPSAKVQLKKGGVNSGSVCTANATTGVFACTTAALTAATYTITAFQTDVAGNVSADSTGVAIEIDTTAPTAPTGLALTTASDNGTSTSDRITSITALVVTGNGVNGSLVQLKVGGTNSGSTCVVSSGVFSCTTGTVSSGVQSITAVQIDSAGNTSSASTALSVTIDTSEAAPTGLVLAAASDSGSSSADGITSATSLVITGTAAAGVTVQLQVGGGDSGSTCAAHVSTGAFACTTGTVSAGVVSITATATDQHGNVSAASTAISVTVDTSVVAPSGLAVDAASDSGSSNSDGVTNDTTPTVTGTAEAGASVQLSVDGVSSGAACTANGSGVFSCTTALLGEGSRVVTAVATDVAGNVSVSSSSLTVTIDVTAPSVPGSMAGSLTCRPTWCNSDYIATIATPSFIADAPNDTQAQLYIAGVATGSVCTTSNGLSAGSFACTTAALVDGSYSVTAKLLDLAGNLSSGTYTARNFQVVAGYVPTTTTSSTSSTSSTTSTTSTTVAPTTITSTTTTTSSTTTSSLATTTVAPATTVAATTTTVAVQTGSGRLVWYADSEVGSDSAGTGSQQAPFKTFHRAYSAARAGDIIDLTGTFTWSDAAETGDVAGAGYRLSKNLTIRGQGEDKTIVEAASRENVADRAVFTNGAVVTIADLTVRHGKVTGGGQGGGITNRSQLTLRSMTVRDNRSVTASRYSFYTAGGVFTDSNTTLTMDKVTVKDNVCDCILYAAGGVYALQSAKKTITNSTFAGNRASASRIGPYPYSYASAAGAFNTFRFGFTVITNSTFFGNYSADYAGAINIYYQDYANLTNLTVVSNEATTGAGGILYRSEWDGYNLNMKNVLLANNRGGGEANDFYAFNAASASRMTSSHNIVEFSTNKTFSGVGEIVGQQDSLDLASVLAPNGTRNGTDTLLVGRDSIAKDAGDAAPHGGRVKATPAETDQRGLGRSGQVDIGAFENRDETNGVASIVATTSTSSTTSSTTSTTSVPRVNTTLPRPTTTLARSTTTSEVTDVTINPNIVATTAPTASTIPDDDAEDLTVEPTTDTEVRASNDSVEIVLSIVDKSFSALVQGRTGRLVAKQGLFARIRGKGFLAGSLAEVWVYSTPRLLAHLQVSGKGEAAGYVLIPEDMELGDHKVELRGKSNRRRVVKATIPLTILDDGVPASTIPPSAADLETALQLPTLIPALVLPAPTDGVISIGEDVISGVLAEVLGESFDLSKVKVRLRINKSEWQLVDTSTGKVIAVVAPVQTGENQIEFEVTDEDGETVVVQRKVLVEGTPEATAYVESQSPVDSSDSSWWRFLLVVVAVAVAAWLVVVATRRRRQS